MTLDDRAPLTTRLRGGPQDGMTAVTIGRWPVVILEAPTRASVHEMPAREAVWDDDRQWYAVPEEIS